MTFGSCGSSSDEIYTGNSDSRYIDILIDKEQHRTLVLEERIDHLTNALMLVSHQFSDSLINFKNDSKKFKPTVSLIQEYNKTCDKKLIESIRIEFKRLKEYLKTYERVSTEQVKILDDFSFEQTLSFFSKSSDSTLCRYVSVGLSNDFLDQKLEIVRFKYDSLLYVLKDSINLSKMNPYEKNLIITEEVQRHSAHPTEE